MRPLGATRRFTWFVRPAPGRGRQGGGCQWENGTNHCHGQYMDNIFEANADLEGMLIPPDPHFNVELGMGGDLGVRTFLPTPAPLLAISSNIISGVRGGVLRRRVRIYCPCTVPRRCPRRRRMCNRYRHTPHRHGRRGRRRRGPADKSAGRQLGRSAGRRSARQQVGKSAGRQVRKSADSQVGRSAGRQIGRSAGRHVGRSAGRQVGRPPFVTRGVGRNVLGLDPVGIMARCDGWATLGLGPRGHARVGRRKAWEHLHCESTSGLQWPHNGLTMATQWPLVISQVAPSFRSFKKDQG